MNSRDNLDLISLRSEVFRAKIIRKFRMLDSVGEAGHVDVGLTSKVDLETNDILDEDAMARTLKTEPRGLIQLATYSDKVSSIIIDHVFLFRRFY